ncbi:MAG: hypothetical protein HN348_29815 [Proteobacteria bacterium]|nr:hypothetical protein [Pseudomonadota bacterium]
MAAALVIFAWAVFWPSSPNRGFSAETAPMLLDGTEYQQTMDMAWKELLANEDLDAMSHLNQLREVGVDDPAVFMLAAVIEGGCGNWAGWEREVRQAASLAEGRVGAVDELAWEVGKNIDNREPWTWWPQVMHDHMERYPDDLLGQYLNVLGMRFWHLEVPLDEPALDRLEAAVPNAVAPIVLRAGIYQEMGRRQDARIALEVGLERNPRSAQLLAGLAATDLLDNPEEALLRAQRALQLDSSWYPARATFAIAALKLDREDDFQWMQRSVIGDEISSDACEHFVGRVGAFLVEQGRLREAGFLWDHMDERFQEDSNYVGRAKAAYQTIPTFTHQWLATSEQLEDRLERLEASLATPNLGGVVHQNGALMSSFVRGLLDARAGRVDSAERARQQLVQLRQRWEQRARLLEMELLAARSEAGTLLAGDDSCVPMVKAGTLLVDMGEVAAKVLFERVLNEQSFCDSVQQLALARAGMVLMALEEGNDELAREHLAALQSLWPRADPELPVMRRIAAAMAEQD